MKPIAWNGSPLILLTALAVLAATPASAHKSHRTAANPVTHDPSIQPIDHYVPGHYVPPHSTNAHFVPYHINKAGKQSGGYEAPYHQTPGHFVEAHWTHRHPKR